MKLLTVVSFLFLIEIPTFAQENPDKLQYLTKVEKYRKMKNTGTTLTVLGGVLFVGGYVAMINSSFNVWTGDESGNFEAGAVAYLLGAGGLGSGIPLWIVGANNHRKYKDKLEGHSVRLQLSTQSMGLTLTYRF